MFPLESFSVVEPSSSASAPPSSSSQQVPSAPRTESFLCRLLDSDQKLQLLQFLDARHVVLLTELSREVRELVLTADNKLPIRVLNIGERLFPIQDKIRRKKSEMRALELENGNVVLVPDETIVEDCRWGEKGTYYLIKDVDTDEQLATPRKLPDYRSIFHDIERKLDLSVLEEVIVNMAFHEDHHVDIVTEIVTRVSLRLLTEGRMLGLVSIYMNRPLADVNFVLLLLSVVAPGHGQANFHTDLYESIWEHYRQANNDWSSEETLRAERRIVQFALERCLGAFRSSTLRFAWASTRAQARRMFIERGTQWHVDELRPEHPPWSERKPRIPEHDTARRDDSLLWNRFRVVARLFAGASPSEKIEDAVDFLREKPFLEMDIRDLEVTFGITTDDELRKTGLAENLSYWYARDETDL